MTRRRERRERVRRNKARRFRSRLLSVGPLFGMSAGPSIWNMPAEPLTAEMLRLCLLEQGYLSGAERSSQR